MVQEDVSVREETHRGVEAGYKCWARDGRQLRGRDQVDKLKGPQVCFQHGGDRVVEEHYKVLGNLVQCTAGSAACPFLVDMGGEVGLPSTWWFFHCTERYRDGEW